MNEVSPINGYFAEALGSALLARATATETLASGDRLLTTFVFPSMDGGLEASVLSGPGRDGADSAHVLVAVDLDVVVPQKNLAAARHFARLFGLFNQPFGLVVDGDQARLTYAMIFYPGHEAVFPAVLTALADNVAACRSGLRRIAADGLSEEDAESAAFILWPFTTKDGDNA